MLNKQVSKCSFCKYFSGKSCMARQNSNYCREALDEYYAWLKNKGQQQPQKSLRPWERKR